VATDLDGAFHAIINAVRSGEIPESQIDESVRKILEMKASVGLDKSRFVDANQANTLTSRPEDMEFAQHVADQAVTLVRNNGQVLPMQKAALNGNEGNDGSLSNAMLLQFCWRKPLRAAQERRLKKS